jgi:hypothetical protein
MLKPVRNDGSNNPPTMSALRNQLLDGKSFGDPFLEPDELAMVTVNRVTDNLGATAPGAPPALRSSRCRAVSNQVRLTSKTTFFSP